MQLCSSERQTERYLSVYLSKNGFEQGSTEPGVIGGLHDRRSGGDFGRERDVLIGCSLRPGGPFVTGRRLGSILKAGGISRLGSGFACEGRRGVRPPRCNDPLGASVEPWRRPDFRDEMKGSESTAEGG